ncbi:PREDICTED: transcriptional regulator ATRX homolog [Camelina sativa]|uniref:Transcriptional regulator ATRX homolog n=1 Tax=Camelina sativa TaxID=90675 RepID=A0ABM0SRG7_CAMSA|nr:PREDICTED: transcriptional regulator ATRX homolog [Camelina sativa]
MGKHRKRDADLEDDTPSSASSSSSFSSDESDSSSRKRREKQRGRRKSDGGSYEREKRRKREKEKEKKWKKMERRERKRRDMKKKRRSKKRDYESDSESQSGSDDPISDEESSQDEPETVVKEMLLEFPNVGSDLKQLLKMIDDGQAVDIKGISESALKKRLKKLFLSLKLKERGDRVFLLPPGASPSLDLVGHLIKGGEEEVEKNCDDSVPLKKTEKVLADENDLGSNSADDDVAGPKKRVIGPAMPSAELLAAAAKLTEAQAELREAELAEDSEYFIGPAPPAVVAEVASSNEAERFEEVTRIMEAEPDSPYDVLGVNHNMAADNMKKRYWKLSLLVHPDKCSHPQAQEAFILLNKAFKELQDPEKRKAMDDKIKLKEEQEAFKAELRSMQEAAQWRRSQGISMEGDAELLAATEVKPIPKRDEWMTTLPPERKVGVAVQQSTTFSRNAREGRGDTTAWTDTPMDKAERAKMNYLEAYNKASALASNEGENMKRSMDAELVDKYNKEKRAKSLVEKHREESTSSSSRLKKKTKLSSSKEKTEKDEWVGKHPWKPWDRENDLTAGRQKVKLDAEGMAEGLASKFSSGNFQRSFL